MAGDALRVQTQEDPGGPHRDLIARVLVIHRVPVALHHTVTGDETSWPSGPVGERVGGDHVAREVVVGDSQFQRLVDVVVEGRNALFVLLIISK